MSLGFILGTIIAWIIFAVLSAFKSYIDGYNGKLREICEKKGKEYKPKNFYELFIKKDK